MSDEQCEEHGERDCPWCRIAQLEEYLEVKGTLEQAKLYSAKCGEIAGWKHKAEVAAGYAAKYWELRRRLLEETDVPGTSIWSNQLRLMMEEVEEWAPMDTLPPKIKEAVDQVRESIIESGAKLASAVGNRFPEGVTEPPEHPMAGEGRCFPETVSAEEVARREAICDGNIYGSEVRERLEKLENYNGVNRQDIDDNATRIRAIEKRNDERDKEREKIDEFNANLDKQDEEWERRLVELERELGKLLDAGDLIAEYRQLIEGWKRVAAATSNPMMNVPPGTLPQVRVVKEGENVSQKPRGGL